MKENLKYCIDYSKALNESPVLPDIEGINTFEFDGLSAYCEESLEDEEGNIKELLIDLYDASGQFIGYFGLTVCKGVVTGVFNWVGNDEDYKKDYTIL